jgi:tripartite-type tricarboxylate transporter receptor subunit TctC
MVTHRKGVRRLLTGALLAALSAFAAAQSYPSKNIRWIIPFPPGGGTDIIARTLCQKLGEAWHRQVIADNRPGSAGTLGLAAAASAQPDGYTLVLAQLSNLGLAPAMYKNLPYDPKKDLAPITFVLATPFVLVAHPSVPVRNIKELIALARKKPDEIMFGSSGNGTFSHITVELIKEMTGVQMLHVPYKGVPLAMSDLFSGRIGLYMTPIPPVSEWLKAGRIRALGVTSSQRSKALPDVPTIAESGLPGYDAVNWYGVMAPAQTPQEIIGKLNKELIRILHLPDVKSRFEEEGGVVTPSTPAQFSQFINIEIVKWSRVVERTSAKVD